MSEEPTDEPLSASGDDRAVEQPERILEAVGDPVCTFDADGQFGYVNRAFEQQTGYDTEAVRDEPLTLVMDNDDAQSILAAVAELETTDGLDRETVDAALQSRDGDDVPVECNLTLLDSDCPQGDAVLTIRDITARKAREERLARFASVVSHDLRNPLDVALGRAEVLPEIADVDPETEEHLREIHNSLKRMEELIQDVLTLSRQGRGDIETESVALADVARDAWQNVATSNATLTVRTDADIEAHRGRLLRLFENLLRNAVEHGSTSPASHAQQDAVEHGSTNSQAKPDDREGRSPSGSRASPDDAVAHGDTGVAVEIGTFDREGTAGFYVADDGPGIDDADREQLFEGGYSTSDEGTGLGLTIVREIAHAHGWTVSVGTADERFPSGARFEISGVTFV